MKKKIVVEDYEFLKGDVVAIGDTLFMVRENDLAVLEINVLSKGDIIKIGDNMFKVTEDDVEKVMQGE